MNEVTVTISPESLARANIDPALLDCWQVTIAMGLLSAGQSDIRSLLGSQWWFDWSSTDSLFPTLDLEATETRIQALTGLRLVRRPVGRAGLVSACREALDLGRIPIVITDAYLLPWCPYVGRKHVEHSFVVTDVRESPLELTVVDGYENPTEWGHATPLETRCDHDLVGVLERVPGTEVATFVPGEATGIRDRAALFEANLAALRDWSRSDPYRPFVAHYCRPDIDVSGFDLFCEACWTVERRRKLYADWLDDLTAQPGSPFPADLGTRFRAEVVTRWSDVNRFAYLALRRLRAGRAPAGSIADLVTAAAEAEYRLVAELLTAFDAAADSRGESR